MHRHRRGQACLDRLAGARRRFDRLVRTASWLGLAASVALASPGPLAADDEPPAKQMDPDEFREGLRRRGLIDLLEFHLRETPVADEIEAALLRRDVLLAAYADDTRTTQERRAALTEANELLGELIAANPDDRRALKWRLDLGQSLLYQEAEPYCVSVLYRGGADADRQALARIMDEAIRTLDAALALLVVEFERLDQLNLAEFERLERQGFIEQLEQFEPQAKYLRRWALFYRATARAPDDSQRLAEWRSVVDELRDQTDLLATPHEVTHFQAQALLLSGMAARRLGDYALALEQLAKAMAIVGGLTDPLEQRDLHWAATLARLERARALGDARHYDQADRAVADFRAWIAETSPDNFGFELVAARLEGSLAEAQAKRAEIAGNSTLARQLYDRALEPLMALARRSEAYRDAVYADLYATLDRDVDPARLHPFVRCALIAGLLAEAEAPLAPTDDQDATSAERIADRRRRLLDQAIAAAEQSLAEASTLGDELHAEVLYNLGVAYYRRGRRLESARAFADAAGNFPAFARAQSAATLAVQTASELYEDPSLSSRPEIRDLYLHAVELLVDRYPDSPAGTYWRFFCAQALEEVGRFADGAVQYARVGPQHEHYVQARFAQAQCLAQAARQLVETDSATAADSARQVVAAVRAAEKFIADATNGTLSVPDGAGLDRLVARTVVSLAELSVLPGVDRFSEALDTVKDFEQRYPQATDLVGAVLRVRIIAYEGLGQLDQAEAGIPRYIQSDPGRAVATLQSLLEAKRAEIEKLRQRGRHAQAHRQAESALVLAEQIQAWASGPDAGLSEADRAAVTLQLAEAYLTVGDFERAHNLFQRLQADGHDKNTSPLAARVVFGLADALFGLGRYDEALPHYNRLCQQLERNTPLWWRALLGDLECRTKLGRDPAGVVRVIEQQRYLYQGQLGGPQFEARFQALLDTNRARLDERG